MQGKIRAVAFDVYKTLIDIETDEASLQPYEFLCRWLSYHGVDSDPATLRGRYLELCSDEFAKSAESYPDFDIGIVFSSILRTTKLPHLNIHEKARELALLFRISTTRSISIIPGALPLLTSLRGKVKLGIVSNAQHLFTVPELSKFGLMDLFDAIALSSDVGARKPDPKIFVALLHALAVPPEEVVFIGDNILDDVYGAREVGMKTIWINRANESPLGPATPDFEVKAGSFDEISAALLPLLES